MKFTTLQAKGEKICPGLSAEDQMLVDLIMPVCEQLHRENQELRAENHRLRKEHKCIQLDRRVISVPASDF